MQYCLGSHDSENSPALIGYLGELLSMELRRGNEALRDIALGRQQNNNSKTIRNNDLLIMFQVHEAKNKHKSF